MGNYLHSRDNSRSVEEHLQHIYRTCIVHYNRYIIYAFIYIINLERNLLIKLFFKRNIDRIREINDENKNLMKAIPYLETPDEVNNVFETLKKLQIKAVDGDFFYMLFLLSN